MEDEIPDQHVWDNTFKVAAAGGLSGVVSEDDTFDAIDTIVDCAPLSIQDDLDKACAYYVYRQLLINAVNDNDYGRITYLQQSILILLDD